MRPRTYFCVLAADYERLDVESGRYREALAELVRLHDGPRDEAYEQDKPMAWQAAREVLAGLTPFDEQSSRKEP